MRINVAQQLKGSVGDIRFYDIDEITKDDVPIQGNVKFVRTNRSILVTGRFTAKMVTTCNRCLEEFPFILEFGIEEEYFPIRGIPGGLAELKTDDTEAFIINDDHIIDLSEAVRQGILLAFPTKPICRPECTW